MAAAGWSAGLGLTGHLPWLLAAGASAWLAWRAGRLRPSAGELFLAGRQAPAWAACLSFVAAEATVLTVVGLPATAFRGDWRYLEYFAGSAVARLAIVAALVPALHESGCLTLYGYLGRRFGPWTRSAAGTLFVAARIVASGAMLMAAGAAASALLGCSPALPVAGLALLAAAAHAWGGARAAVWMGALQAAILLAAGAAALAFVVRAVDGGLAGAVGEAGRAGRLAVFDWRAGSPDFAVWAVVQGFFGSLAGLGADHETMQRAMAVGSRRSAGRAVAATVFVSLAVLVLHLAIGTGMFVYYAQHSEFPLPVSLDRVYLHFAAQVMPPFLRGVALAAMLAAAADLPLASLSAVLVDDLILPWSRRGAGRGGAVIARAAMPVFAAALAAVAWAASGSPAFASAAYKAGGIAFGALAGAFVLGLATRTRGDLGVAAAAAASAALHLTALVFAESRGLGAGWLIVSSTATSAALGAVLGPAFETAADQREAASRRRG